jgi:hypothetical protein
MIRDSWNRIRAGGPPTIAGLALLLLASIGNVLGLAGYRFPVEASRASRVALALIALVLVVAAAGRLASRQSTANRPDQATVDRWFPLLLGLGLSCVTVGLLLSPR